MLKGRFMKTKQEILDIVANHLLAQNEKAHNEDEYSCAYLDPEGRKCAVGCLIPDDQYSKELEGAIITSNPKLKALPCMQGLDIDFLRALQMIHDFRSILNWRMELENLANQNNLEINF